MISARELPARDYLALKAAHDELLEAAGGTRNAARHTRVGHQHLSKCASTAEEHEEMFFTADVTADLESIAGEPLLTRKQAELQGFGLYRLPETRRGKSNLGRISGEAMKEVSDVFATLGRQLADGVLTSAEGPQFDREVSEAIEMLLTLRAQHAADVDRGGR